jgi:hypothetical protein
MLLGDCYNSVEVRWDGVRDHFLNGLEPVESVVLVVDRRACSNVPQTRAILPLRRWSMAKTEMPNTTNLRTGRPKLQEPSATTTHEDVTSDRTRLYPYLSAPRKQQTGPLQMAATDSRFEIIINEEHFICFRRLHVRNTRAGSGKACISWQRQRHSGWAPFLQLAAKEKSMDTLASENCW